MKMSLFILLGLVSFGFSTTAFADDITHKYKELTKALSETKEREKSLNREINELKKERAKIKAAKTRNRKQALCDTCGSIAKTFCNVPKEKLNPPSPCAQGDCVVDLKPAENICHRIYLNKTCYGSVLTAAVKAKVDSCWIVQNDLKVAKIDADIADIQKELEDVAQINQALSQKQSALEEDCPECVKQIEKSNSATKSKSEQKTAKPLK